MKNLTSKTQVTIHASAGKVWDALTNPKLIKQYLFGTNASSDWKEGSPLTFKGSYNGKSYKDKGEILKSVPKKVLQHTYWSSMSGMPDKPENYYTVTYRLSPQNGKTLLTITQNKIANEKARQGSKKNWRMVLDKMKETVEKNN